MRRRKKMMARAPAGRDAAEAGRRAACPCEALTRARAYATLAWAFSYPASEPWQPELPPAMEEGHSHPGPRRPVGEVALALADPGRLPPLEGLRSEHVRLFSSGVLCPHYETEYTATHVYMKGQEMADVAGFYRAFGLDPQGERVDFIGTELEFMEVLALKEAALMERGDEPGTEIVRDAERKFLRDHLGRWAGIFGSRLRREAALPWHREVGRALEEFVADEAARAGVSPDPLPTPNPSSPTGALAPEAAAEEGCEGCPPPLPHRDQPGRGGSVPVVGVIRSPKGE